MEPSDGCRLWPFGTDQDGYGRFWVEQKEIRVNSLTCEVWHGPQPADAMHAAHTCGNVTCWAGEHLYWATPRENVLDKNTHGTMVRGEQHHRAKLTEADVLDIRARYERRGTSQVDMARIYGVSPATIYMIIKRKNWTHI